MTNLRTISLRTATAAAATAMSLGLSLAASGCSSAAPGADADAESTSQAIANGPGLCGRTPLAPICNVPRCTADGWEYVPSPAGYGCKLSDGTAGTCNGGTNGLEDSGKCLGPVKTGTVYPAYDVIGIAYAPPGTGSAVSYGSQSTFGSEVDIQNLFKGGTQIGESGSIVGFGAAVQLGVAVGPVDGTSWETSKTVSSGIQVTSEVDALDHLDDTFFLWVDAELQVSQQAPGPVVTSLASRDGTSMTIVPVTVAELRNPSLLAGTWKASALAALTPADYASVLTLDPLVPYSRFATVVTPAPDPTRFNFIKQLPIDGPDHAGDPVVAFPYSMTNEQTSGTSTGTNTATTVSITFSAGFNVGWASDSASVGHTYEWDYQRTEQSKQGTAQTASVTLQTPTVGYHQVVNVYFDTMFNSFAFAYPSVTTIEE